MMLVLGHLRRLHLRVRVVRNNRGGGGGGVRVGVVVMWVRGHRRRLLMGRRHSGRLVVMSRDGRARLMSIPGSRRCGLVLPSALVVSVQDARIGVVDGAAGVVVQSGWACRGDGGRREGGGAGDRRCCCCCGRCRSGRRHGRVAIARRRVRIGPARVVHLERRT